MKRLLIILMAFLLGTSLKAQDTSSHKMHHQMKDCVMMKEGKMIQMKDGKEMERFTKITDPKIIAELEKIRDAMY